MLCQSSDGEATAVQALRAELCACDSYVTAPSKRAALVTPGFCMFHENSVLLAATGATVWSRNFMVDGLVTYKDMNPVCKDIFVSSSSTIYYSMQTRSSVMNLDLSACCRGATNVH